MATSPDARRYQINVPLPEREKQKRFLRLARAELRTWEETEGWFYWNYQLLRDRRKKTDEYFKEAWDFARCMERGWLPAALESE